MVVISFWFLVFLGRGNFGNRGKGQFGQSSIVIFWSAALVSVLFCNGNIIGRFKNVLFVYFLWQ